MSHADPHDGEAGAGAGPGHQQVRLASIQHQERAPARRKLGADAHGVKQPLLISAVTYACIGSEAVERLLERCKVRLVARRREDAVAAGAETQARQAVLFNQRNPVGGWCPLSSGEVVFEPGFEAWVEVERTIEPPPWPFGPGVHVA